MFLNELTVLIFINRPVIRVSIKFNCIFYYMTFLKLKPIFPGSEFILAEICLYIFSKEIITVQFYIYN